MVGYSPSGYGGGGLVVDASKSRSSSIYSPNSPVSSSFNLLRCEGKKTGNQLVTLIKRVMGNVVELEMRKFLTI